MICKHEWKILSETITESKIEHLQKLGAHGSRVSIPPEWVKRKLIQIVTCPKCGGLKRFVETI